MAAGRPRKSLVWNFFEYERDKDKSVCQVLTKKVGKEEKCGKVLNGAFTSNMKKHLKASHKEEFLRFEKEEDERQKSHTHQKRGSALLSSSHSQQMTIKEAMKPTVYSKDSKKQLGITNKLAIFIGATSVPLSLVDCPEFCDLLKEMDKQYDIPGRKKLGKDIDDLYINLKHNMSLKLNDAKRISLCSDIWSKQGMTASFLGVTAHFFTFSDKQHHNLTLAVRRFESPHTAERIAALLQLIVHEWKIEYKVFRILTDNGSNMVKAFHLAVNDSHDDLHDDVGEGSTLTGDSESETDGEASLNFVDDEIKEFEQFEEDQAQAFVQWKRNSCFVHTLQLVVKVFEKNPCFKSTLSKASKIVRRVNKSCKATEMLIKLAGIKLVSACPTRWDSMFLMISRMILVKDHLNEVLDSQGWDTLTISQWKQISAVQDLLKPFAHHTNITSAEDSSSICMVIPVLKELDLHLKEVCTNRNVNFLHAV